MLAGVKGAPGGGPIVAMRAVVKRYGAVEALRGLDLDVPPGCVYGFLGRNGAGKSTALRIIMGITRATAGEVRLFGGEPGGDEAAVRRRIGYVAQEQAFYGWMTPVTLGRFVAGFYPTWDGGEYDRLLALLDLPRDRRVQTFSGGMNAKLALALALAHRPELLVLDEPTAGMDAVTRREFLALVRGQSRSAGRATLFSSHLIDEVEMAADVIGIVEGGRTLWEGPPGDLQRQLRSVRYAGPADEAPPLDGMLTQVPSLSVIDDHTDAGRRTITVRAEDPTAFDALAHVPPGWQVVVPTLEDAFVALVHRPLVY